jgi:integrase
VATIIKTGKGKMPPRAIQFALGGERKTLRIGVVRLEEAQQIKTQVERLVAARTLNQPLAADLASWVAGLPPDMHARFTRACLVDSRDPVSAAPRLRTFLARHLWHRRRELKPASRQILRTTIDHLLSYFTDNPHIDAITPDRAADWRSRLAGKGLAEATIRGYCRYVKVIFGESSHGAVGRGLLPRNPFGRLASSAIAADRSRYITPADTDTLIATCPNVQWRTLVGLARLAGLRTPSESHRLTWADVDWSRRRLTVFAPKTGKTRIVPIMPKLLAILQEAFDAATEGQERIITLSTNNLQRGLSAIIKRAGVKPWEDLFQALRRSCETEWAQSFPQGAVSEWIGHSIIISARHYLSVPDSVYDKAAGLLGTPENALQIALQQRAASLGMTTPEGNRPPIGDQNGPVVMFADSTPCSVVQKCAEMARGGLEPPTPAFSMRCSTN